MKDREPGREEETEVRSLEGAKASSSFPSILDSLSRISFINASKASEEGAPSLVSGLDIFCCVFVALMGAGLRGGQGKLYLGSLKFNACLSVFPFISHTDMSTGWGK